MTTFGRNLLLTLLLLSFAAVTLIVDGLDGPTRAGVVTGCLAFISGLWLRSGKDGDGGLSPVLPLACLALLVFGCNPTPGGVTGLVNVVQHHEALGGSNSDYVRLTTQASLPAACASPYGCLYMRSSDSLPRLVDPSGNEYTAGTTWRARQYAGTPGGVATYDIWADTTTGYLMWRHSSGSLVLGHSGGWVTLDTAQTITGTKTFTQGVSTTGSPYALKLSGGAHTTLTASTEANDVYYDLSRTVQFATGALATQRAFLIDAPTYAFVGASTVTNAATLAIENAPQAGTNATLTNAWALWVQAGATRLTGALSLGGNVTMATTTTLAAGANTLVSGDKLQAAQLAVASQATGDLLYASSGTAWGRLAVGSTGQVLSVSGGVPAWATPVYAMVTGGCRGALGAATGYASAPGVAWSTTTEPVLLVATRAGTVRNLYCDLGTAPGGADTVVVTVRKNAADQATTCTISAAGTTCSDTSNTFAVVAGNRVSIKGVSSAGTAADLHCSFEVGL